MDLSGIDVSKVGDFVVDNDECTINTDSNLASCGDGANVLAFKVATQSDGSQVAVYVAKSMTILSGQNLTVVGSRPFVFIATGTITIDGTLNGNGKSDVGNAGGPSAQETSFTQGIGLGGGGAGTPSTGGGGASYCGTGGPGGAESGTPSSAAAAYGTTAITPLVGGSSGGAGSGFSGSGGGAIQLVAGTSITIDAAGLIQVGGGGGAFGGISGQEANGGGSGGSILLESLAVTIDGTLAANGGGGGAGTSADVGSPPPLDPFGADATPNATAAAGGKAGVGPSSGGDGSAATTVNGAAGSFTAGNSAGGGGGGAGRIRINTESGAATLAAATISPGMSTPCATQGTL
ncbi:MAG TPA: hypothetical protein VLM85_12760 [Polyangiaceae bacterium]|nr:hypothetical protein [Polyangiaceae bacterium]